jgi:hypothetical protein
VSPEGAAGPVVANRRFPKEEEEKKGQSLCVFPRLIDRNPSDSMEKKKQEAYF